MTTCITAGLTEPLRFLKSTVLSFNSTLGLGSNSESSLNVDLVDDCLDEAQAGAFGPINDPINYTVGAPVYFPDNPAQMAFSFGGVLTNWTVQRSSSGKTYNVKVSDPRQLMENTVVVVDSYLGSPQKHVNYFNAYAYYEQNVLNGDCTVFGSSRSTERGMPATKILEALSALQVYLCSATGYVFKVDISTFPGWVGCSYITRQLPSWYRIAGPSISLLQLLQDICDVLAYDFYVELVFVGGENLIRVGLVDLNANPLSFSAIVGGYANISTELSYGQELRNEKTKTVIFGEQVHYISIVDSFDFFFGEDVRNGVLTPVVPYKHDTCGFWIQKNIETLNVALDDPINSNGPFNISELDIRAAMSSYELWVARTFDENTPGSFNEAVRGKYPNLVRNFANSLKVLEDVGGAVDATGNAAKGIVDQQQNPNRALLEQNQPNFVNELKKIHGFINNLGNTYYGKQFISKLSEQICYIDNIDGEGTPRHYSSLPTNAGGWVEFGTPVLGLFDPELGVFRSEDNRVNSFAVFSTVNNAAPLDDPEKSDEQTDFFDAQDKVPEQSPPQPAPET